MLACRPSLGYAILFVSDLDRAIGFYRDVIAVPLRFRADAYAGFATDGAKFALFPRSELTGLIGHYAPPDPAPWPQGEVAFFVDDFDGSTRGSKTRASLCSLRRPTGRGASGRCTSPTRTGTWWSSRGPAKQPE
jgi:catechol 2,3-dioxygenase-like lactoylglutathione lyase family enzyme